jgi:hypothetical protein
MFSRNLTSRQIMNAVWALGASSTFEACVERPIVIEQPHAWYLLTFPVRFDEGFLNFGMRITASGDVLSIRFGCLGVLVYPKQPDPGYGEAVCQSVGGCSPFLALATEC